MTETSETAPAPLGRVPAGAAYASNPERSRGRRHGEAPSPSRTPYQRDRDRIIHSTAFRRLTHKTQVFVPHEGDHYRTRLTHSLEVAQIARSMARTLALNEDLAEAIALAHDLGHPPFGHAGERALNAAMAAFGGFDHNAQSLKVVTALERKYAAFDGLNLTWETLEGLAKHNGPLLDADGAPLEEGAGEGVAQITRCTRGVPDLELHLYPCAEAQVASLADDIAYNNHDIDDGFRAGLLSLDDLRQVPLVGDAIAEVEGRHAGLERSRLIYEVNRRLITVMINDVVGETAQRLEALGPGGADAVRGAGRAIASFSEPVNGACDELRFFLLSFVYRDARIMRIMGDAEGVVRDLFARYLDDPGALPEKWFATADQHDRERLARHVCDFIAGMTDRYALQEHRRLFDATPDLR